MAEGLVKTIADTDIMKPTRFYTKATSKYPLLDSALWGTGGALAGYLGTDLLAGKLMPGEDPERIQMLKKIMAGLGAAGGAIYGAQKHMDPKSPFKSLVQPDYWKKNPEALADARARNQQRIDNAKVKATQLPKFDWGRGGRGLDPRVNIIPYEARQLLPSQVIEAGEIGIPKEGSFSNAFEGRTVPVATSLNLIDNDPFLTLGEKNRVGGYIIGANNGLGAGKTSQKSLMNTAIRAGLGFGAAYLFGKGIGSLFSLPPEQTKKLSQVGGIAGALYNSGILHEGLGQ
jgi:hypothetical protein